MIWVNFDGAGQQHDWRVNLHKQTGSIGSIFKLDNILFALFMKLLLLKVNIIMIVFF